MFSFIENFLLSSQSNFVLLLCATKIVNKQGYIHASYHFMSTHFSTHIIGNFSGLNLAHA